MPDIGTLRMRRGSERPETTLCFYWGPGLSLAEREGAPGASPGFGAVPPECPAKFGTTVSRQRDNQVVTLPTEQRCTQQIAATLGF